MCPAVILAANRKDKVIGRTIILKVSTITKNGFNQSGAPPGNKEALAETGEYIKPDKIKDSQIGNPNTNVMINWLDILKEYGINPIKLVTNSIINTLVIIEEKDFKCCPKVRSDWEFITSWGNLTTNINLEGFNQYIAWIGNNALTAVNQNKLEYFSYPELIKGSKEEKISTIIKIWT